MKVATFQTLIMGLLCLAVAGLSAGMYNLSQRVAHLQSESAQERQTLSRLQQQSIAFKDAHEQVQSTLNALTQKVDTPPPTHPDPLLDQWAPALQALRDDLTGRASVNDMTVLSVRLAHLEQQLLALKHTPLPVRPAAAKPKQPAPAKPAPLIPPFSVLSIESRGEERFLAVAPLGSHRLSDVRLLRRGEQFGAWHLKTLGTHSATFAVAARPDQTVPLP